MKILAAILGVALLASCAGPAPVVPVKPTIKPAIAMKPTPDIGPKSATITLAWNPNQNAEQITGYNLYVMFYDGSKIWPWMLKTTIPASQAPSWTGTIPFGLYLFRVTAVSPFGESAPSNQARYATQ